MANCSLIKIKKLKTKIKNLNLYFAGYPRYQSVFSRDTFIAGILTKNKSLLKNQLIFSIINQGKKKDKFTGEEPGKIYHQYPPKKINNLSTLYNACDTTALFLIAFELYYRLSKDNHFLKTHQLAIKKAVKYIISHLKNGGFFEDPKLSGANQFALKVTYWKDSELPLREKGRPVYPIIYTLAHVQNLKAIKSAAFLLKDKKLKKISDEMLEFLFTELKDEKFGFCLFKDKLGAVSAPATDLLQILFYLEKNELEKYDKKIIQKINQVSKKIETPIGFRCLDKKTANLVKDKYHTDFVWPYEQALIFEGAKKFKLLKIASVASRVKKFIKNDYPEIFLLKNKKIEKAGCFFQLWTWAASCYFEKFAQKTK